MKDLSENGANDQGKYLFSLIYLSLVKQTIRDAKIKMREHLQVVLSHSILLYENS